MIKRLSLVTSGLLLTSTMALAGDAKVAGSAMLYHSMADNKDLTTASMNLTVEKPFTNEISGKVAYQTTSVIDEENQSGGDVKYGSLLTEANLTYAGKGYSFTLGRQAIDLEWMGDYHEAAVLAVTSIKDTTLVAGYTAKKAAADEDEIGNFEDVNSDKGAYVIDAKYSGIKSVELNPYFYSASDVASFYGLKGTYSTDAFSVMGHYAASSEDKAGKKDGSLMAVEASTTVSKVSLTAGYFATDKDGGLGNIAAFGDNYSPFDSGDMAGDADATAMYVSASGTVSKVELGALYGIIEAGTKEDKELNITADYSFTDSLSGSFLYVDVSGDNEADYSSVSLSYSF